MTEEPAMDPKNENRRRFLKLAGGTLLGGTLIGALFGLKRNRTAQACEAGPCGRCPSLARCGRPQARQHRTARAGTGGAS